MMIATASLPQANTPEMSKRIPALKFANQPAVQYTNNFMEFEMEQPAKNTTDDAEMMVATASLQHVMPTEITKAIAAPTIANQLETYHANTSTVIETEPKPKTTNR